MTRLTLVITAALALAACAGTQAAPESSPTTGAPAETAGASAETEETPEELAAALREMEEGSDEGAGAPVKPTPKKKDKPYEFKENTSGTPGQSRGVLPSMIEPTRTEAALKFTVVDKDKGPIKGLVIKLTGPQGKNYFTNETDEKGYTEVLVPVGQEYEVVYLSLGRKEIAARLPVEDEPRQTIRLTLRYKRYDAKNSKTVGLVLEGVEFDSGKATLRPDSYSKLERVVEYMKYKKSARVEISGHTDNVGNPKRNKALSLKRAQACRKYLVAQGIAADRIEAVGYGEERPLSSNDTPEGRQKNRRIEASEL